MPSYPGLPGNRLETLLLRGEQKPLEEYREGHSPEKQAPGRLAYSEEYRMLLLPKLQPHQEGTSIMTVHHSRRALRHCLFSGRKTQGSAKATGE